jgi:orotate phosphoribosyltransferase
MVAHLTFITNYMDGAVFDAERVVNDAVDALSPFSDRFDTLVGTGLSGGLIVPVLARELDKMFVLVRKDGDDSHHGGGKLLGRLGPRWLFVDDFCSSGFTRDRVTAKINEGGRGAWTRKVGEYYYTDSVSPLNIFDLEEDHEE